MFKNHFFGISLGSILAIATILFIRNEIVQAQEAEIQPASAIQTVEKIDNNSTGTLNAAGAETADKTRLSILNSKLAYPEIEFLDDNIDPVTAQQIIFATDTARLSDSEKYSIAMQSTIHFNPNNISESAGMAREQVSYLIATYCPEWAGLEDYLLRADKQLNLLFILGVARMETWAGEAAIGDYNCFNIKVWNTDDYIDYNSYTESIDAFIRLINSEYLNPDGLWYEGGKAISDIGKHYATDKWAEGITDICLEMKNNAQKG